MKQNNFEEATLPDAMKPQTLETNAGLPPLPDGWEWVSLDKVAKINYREPFIRDLPDELEVTFLPMSAVDAISGTIASPQVKPLKKVRRGYTSFIEGDVLFAKITPSMENGKAAIARGLKNRIGFGSTEFHVLRPADNVIPEWIFYFVRQEQFRRDAKSNFAGTAGQLRVPASFLYGYPIPLAPRPEQERIVARIEALFSHLESAEAGLLRVQRNLKRYRASVLKAAVEGSLTPDRSPAGREETGVELLARILEERRRRWETQEWEKLVARAKQKAAKALGLTDVDAIPAEAYARYLPKSDAWKKKYKAPAPPDTRDLPELPEGWVWATVEQTIQIIDYRGRTPPYSKEGIPHLRSSNVRNGRIIWEDLKFISESAYKQYMTRGLPEKGDLLFTTEAPLGNVTLVPDTRFSVAQRLLVLRPLNDLDSKFLMYQIMSQEFQQKLRYRETGTTVKGVSSRNFKALTLRIPPLAEQERIVAEVERRLSVARQLEETVETNLRRLARLRQAILQAAFAGRL